MTLTFDVDEYRLRDFNEALSILGLSKEEAFDRFLGLLIHEALHPSTKDSSVLGAGSGDNKAPRLTRKTIESRIHAWAAKPKCYPHLMLKAFLQACRNHGTQEEYREKVRCLFNELCGESSSFDNPTFTSVFRQMCSNAARAYGDVFVYSRKTRMMSLNPQYESLIYSLADEFLNRKDEASAL